MDRLAVSLIEQANKPIIGFSDITVYHSAWIKANVASIHSSMSSVFTSLPEQCVEAQRRLMGGEVPSYRCEGSDYDIEGSAQGVLIGGNLGTLTSVLDTAYDCTSIDEPYILFLEDVDEDYENIHRFLTILDHKGILDKAKGLIFGEWVEYPEECETYTGNSRGRVQVGCRYDQPAVSEGENHTGCLWISCRPWKHELSAPYGGRS
jgi:muramoyltetrapeptide carboxypeptidase